MLDFPLYPNILQFNLLSQHAGITGFSTTTAMGYSRDNYHSFNLSYYSGDNPLSVDKNRASLCRALGISPKYLYVPFQTHQTECLKIDHDFLSQSPEQQQLLLHGKDALITQEKDLAIAVTTADCVPILLFDPTTQAAAAIHAGWKGTCQKIVQKTLNALTQHYGCKPSKLMAAIGPSISVEEYEVGDEVMEAFAQQGFQIDTISFRHPVSNKYHLDLWKANQSELLKAGVPASQIEIAGLCTKQNEQLFFSARRMGIKSGRMLTGIKL